MSFNEKNKWWVSPSNYDEEVVAKFNFPKKIEFLDTTLRDGEQQPGIIFTKDEKVAIAKKLAEAGVQRIEAGAPAVLKEDAEAIREIADLGFENTTIYAFVRSMVKDMELARKCGVQGVLTEIPGSEHLLKVGKRWTIKQAIDAAIEGTLAAHELGMQVSFFPADSSRADMSFLIDAVSAIAEKGHMDSLVLVDTFGVFSPEGAAQRVRQLKKCFPDTPLEVHFHDDFGLGVATTIAGLGAGAEVCHVTVNGIGERAGGGQLEAIATALEALYGQKTGLDMTKFKSLSEFVAKAAQMPVPPTKPIVGDDIFQWETGLPSSLWVNVKDIDPLIMLPYHWDMTGHTEPRLLLSKKSGKDNVKTWLEKCHLSVPDDRLGELLNLVKYKSLHEHRRLTEVEFRELVDTLQHAAQ